MATTASARIVTEVHDEPHIAGRRVTVRRIQGLIEDADRSPLEVADELQLDLADIYAALHYYHTHPEDINAAVERRNQRLEDATQAGAKTIEDYKDDEDSDGAAGSR
jgi:uncharacterized protein (DUF433 family)